MGASHEDSACGGQWVLWWVWKRSRLRRTGEHHSEESLLVLAYSSAGQAVSSFTTPEP